MWQFFFLLANRRAASDRATFVPSTMSMVVKFFFFATACYTRFAVLSEVSLRKMTENIATKPEKLQK